MYLQEKFISMLLQIKYCTIRGISLAFLNLDSMKYRILDTLTISPNLQYFHALWWINSGLVGFIFTLHKHFKPH